VNLLFLLLFLVIIAYCYYLHYGLFSVLRSILSTLISSFILIVLSLFAASDLDCIRALFNEKEKELSLAVAKVEELTRQLEELRGRQNNPIGSGTVGSIGGGLTGTSSNGHLVTPASAELEKLRRELMVSLRHRLSSQRSRPRSSKHSHAHSIIVFVPFSTIR